MQVHYDKIIKWSIAIAFIAALAILYRQNDPNDSVVFPKCPFYVLTGFKCPGCGSQRAVHHLLNFDIKNAFKENAILVISIPYIVTGLAFDFVKKPNVKLLKWRKALFGQKAIFVILLIIIAFWILRNITFYQQLI